MDQAKKRIVLQMKIEQNWAAIDIYFTTKWRYAAECSNEWNSDQRCNLPQDSVVATRILDFLIDRNFLAESW